VSVRTYLEEHHVFSLDAFRSEMGRGASAYNLLTRAVNKGSVDRVMRGVYVSRTGQFSQTEPDPYLVAEALAEDVVMVYHSALELHGLAHSPSRRVQFTSSRATPRFVYRDFEFERYAHPKALSGAETLQSTTLVGRPQGVVRVTTRERTLVDCVNRADLAGGLEEVTRSLAALPYVDASKVLTYLEELGARTAVARTGWLLEQRQDDWYVSATDLEEMRSMLGPGPYYFTRNNEAGQWVPSWRLYLPPNAEDLQRWVHE